jgi:predicted phage-related endonuclease
MSDNRPNNPLPDELNQLRNHIKALKAREEEVKAALLKDPETRTGNHWVAQIRTTVQHRTDIKEMREVHPDIVEEFTFPSTYTSVDLLRITEDGELISARSAAGRGK